MKESLSPPGGGKISPGNLWLGRKGVELGKGSLAEVPNVWTYGYKIQFDKERMCLASC